MAFQRKLVDVSIEAPLTDVPVVGPLAPVDPRKYNWSRSRGKWLGGTGDRETESARSSPPTFTAHRLAQCVLYSIEGYCTLQNRKFETFERYSH